MKILYQLMLVLDRWSRCIVIIFQSCVSQLCKFGSVKNFLAQLFEVKPEIMWLISRYFIVKVIHIVILKVSPLCLIQCCLFSVFAFLGGDSVTR